MMHKYTTRAEAKAAGVTHYYPQKPCCHGHEGKRLVSNSCCCACMLIGTKKYRSVPEKAKFQNDRQKERTREYRKNPEYAARERERRNAEARTEKGRKRARNNYLRNTMGITTEEAEAVLVAQGHKCAICERDLTHARLRQKAHDHDHKTGKFRGILCVNCNTSIGKFKECTATLQRAIAYLEKHAA